LPVETLDVEADSSEVDADSTEDTVDSEVDAETVEGLAGGAATGCPAAGTTGVAPLAPNLKRKPIPMRATVAPAPA